MHTYVIAGNDADGYTVWAEETNKIKGVSLTFKEAVALRKLLEENDTKGE